MKVFINMNQFLVSLGILVLLISLVLNFYLFFNLKKYVTNYFIQKLDPLACPFEKAYSTGDYRILFLGDSRADTWARLFGNKNYSVLNMACDGFTSMQTKLMMDAQKINYSNFEYVVIQLGINDLKCISLAPEKEGEIINNCIKNISEIIDTIAKYDTQIIFTSIFPTSTKSFSRMLFFGRGDINKYVDEVNSEIEIKFSEQNIIYLNTKKILSNNEGYVTGDYAQDYLHINKNGYNELNKQLINLLKIK